MIKTEWKTLVKEIQEKNTEISKDDIKKAIKKAYKKAAKSMNKFNNYKMMDLNWNDLPIDDIRDLVNQYMDLDKEEQIQKESQKTSVQVQETERKTEVNLENGIENKRLSLEEKLKQKIDKHEPLTERELETLLEFEIEREEGENLRWTRNVSSIIELCNEYYELNWYEGLTEMQENEFYDQPYHVIKQETTKTITVTEWIRNDYDFEEEQEDEMDLE